MFGSNKIRILFLIGSFDVGGKEKQLALLIKNLPKSRYQIYLFSKYIRTHYSKEIKNNVYHIYNLNRNNFKLSDILRLGIIVQKIRPDVIYSWAETTSYFSLLVFYFYRLLLSCKFILIDGSIRSAPVISTLRIHIRSLISSLFSVVVSNSYSGLKAFHQNGKKNRFVLFNGIEMNKTPSISKEHAKQVLGFPQNKIIVSMIANLTIKKDHMTFLEAIKTIIQKHDDVFFYIVGKGDQENKLIKLAKSSNLEAYLSFLGSRKDIEMIYNATDISVLTSTFWLGEGISNSILESFACSVPVIATDSPGTREIINDGFNGIIVPAGNSKILAEKIVELKDNQKLRITMGKNGNSYIAEKFGIDRMITDFMKIIDKSIQSAKLIN